MPWTRPCPTKAAPVLKPGDYCAPTGKLITGSVFDGNKARIERALKFYDPQLYIKWNPKKRRGWGMWEVRRKPDFLTSVYQGSFNGVGYHTAEYKESDIIHHVLDVPVLTDSLVGKIKSMDTWQTKRWQDHMEYEGAKYQERIEQGAREELRYEIKQHRREWKELAAAVREGVPLGHFLKGIRG